jgi:hypothetical protein
VKESQETNLKILKKDVNKYIWTSYTVQSLYLHTVLNALYVYLYAVPFVIIVGEVQQLQGEGGPQASHQLSVQSPHSHLHH